MPKITKKFNKNVKNQGKMQRKNSKNYAKIKKYAKNNVKIPQK